MAGEHHKQICVCILVIIICYFSNQFTIAEDENKPQHHIR